MKYTLIILTILGIIYSGRSSFAQDSRIIYDGRFDFAWEYSNGSELADTARIYHPKKNSPFLDRFAKGSTDIEVGDRIIAINGASFLKSAKDSSEIYGLKQGAASRTFDFEVYRDGIDSVVKIPVTKETDISVKFPIMNVDYLPDSSGTLTMYDILEDSVQDQFVNDATLKDMIFAAAYGNQCMWFRVNIESRLSTDRTYVLVFSSSNTDTISTYYRNPTGEWVTQYAGIAFNEGLRGYNYKDWSAVKLNLSNKSNNSIYVRVCSENLANHRNTYIQSLEYLHEIDQKERMIFSLLIGMMVLILLLCILIYFSTRVRSYLIFFLFVTGYVFLAFARSRYLAELDHMLAYILTRDFFYLIHILPVACFMWFSLHYMEIRTRYTRWYKLIITTLGLMVFIAVILTLGDLMYDDPGSSNLPALTAKINKITCNYLPYLVLLVPSLRRIRRRDSRGWYILLASLFFIFLGIAQDFIYPGNTVKSLVFGLNTIEQGITMLNYTESVGIIVLFLIYALSPYRS